MVLASASVALAEKPPGPTRFGVVTDPALNSIANHGEHITRDYVAKQGNAGGGRPAHFGNSDDLGPGASFCNPPANSKALPARPNA